VNRVTSAWHSPILSYRTESCVRAERFLDNLEVEHIVLYALAGATKLLSFRTAKLAPWVARELDSMREAAAAAAAAQGEGADEDGGGGVQGSKGAAESEAQRSGKLTKVRLRSRCLLPPWAQLCL
jgi:hypothetical protein